MPTANAPVHNGNGRPLRTPSPSSYLPALQQLASPVPDLASTLTVQADSEINVPNADFVRRRPSSSGRDNSTATEALVRELRNERRRRDGISRPRGISDETWYRYTPEQRLAIVRDRREREEAWTTNMASQSHAALQDAYGARIPPASHQQSLYDWAPAYDRTEAQHLSDIIADLHRQQPNTHPEILRALARTHLDQEREQRIARLQSLANSSHNDASSLRSAAILQSVRRNQRLSARSTPHHLIDREVSLHDADRERWYRRALLLNDANRYEQNRRAWRNSQTSSGSSSAIQLAALRAHCLESSGHDTSSKHGNFGYVIEFMHHRMSASDDEFVERLHEDGHSPKTQPSFAGGDSVLSPPTPPQPTSWLTSGMHFTGSQRTTTEIGAPQPGTTAFQPALMEPSRLSQQQQQPRGDAEARSSFDASRPWLGQGITSTPLRFAAQPATSTNSTPFQDRWTVKVAIHAVDYDNMTLQGTMEAFNVPSVAPPRNTSSRTTTSTNSTSDGSSPSKTTFSTYLEGEIIDFKNHTLLTVPSRFSVNTTPETDAAYWRKLEPFASLQEEELGRAVLDRKWIEEELMSKYVLMRWKERCFVKPTLTSFHTEDSASANMANAQTTLRPDPLPPRDTTTSFLQGADGNTFGLSISGFYYVSLRRSDGKCEGLYMDPQSSPYQHLELSPTSQQWTRGAWEFR